MDPNDLQLALAYSELPASIAWQDFMRFQLMECDRLELLALQATGSPYERLEAICAWQQRKLVVRTMQDAVRDSTNQLKIEQLENEDARPDPSRTDRSGW